jgi:hypothetical protein
MLGGSFADISLRSHLPHLGSENYSRAKSEARENDSTSDNYV